MLASDTNVSLVRKLSRVMCGGAQYRLEVGADISREQIANTLDIAERLGLSRQSVNKELHLLREAGLLEVLTGGDSGARVYLVPVDADAPYWTWCVWAVENAQTLIERGRA